MAFPHLTLEEFQGSGPLSSSLSAPKPDCGRRTFAAPDLDSTDAGCSSKKEGNPEAEVTVRRRRVEVAP